MRITDLFLALPGALVAIAIVAALGSGLVNTLIGVATEAVAGGATDLIGRVRLNGAF